MVSGPIRNGKKLFEVVQYGFKNYTGKHYLFKSVFVPKHENTFPVNDEGSVETLVFSKRDKEKSDVLKIATLLHEGVIDATFSHVVSGNVDRDLLRIEGIPAASYDVREYLTRMVVVIILLVDELIESGKEIQIVEYVTLKIMDALLNQEGIRVVPLSRGVADHLIKKAINTFDVFETYWGVDRPNVNVLPFHRNGNLCYELTHNKSGNIIHLETRSNGGIFFRVKDNLDGIDGKSAKDVYDAISQFVEDGTLPEKINLTEADLSFDGFMEDFWEEYISPICRNYKLQNSFLSHPEGHKSFFKKEDGCKRSLNIDLTAPKDEEKLVKFSVSFKRSVESGKWISDFHVADFYVPLNEVYLFDLYKNVIEFFNNASGHDKDIDVSANLENSLREFAYNCCYIKSFDILTGERECTNKNGNIIWRRT